MNSKKIMAGLLSAAMVVTSFAVPTEAAYTALQKDQSKGGTVESGTLTDGNGNATVATKWWNPNTFPNSVCLTKEQVTITFHSTGGANAPYYCLFSSSTGAMYGSQPTDESYRGDGNPVNMVEYMNVRANLTMYGPADPTAKTISLTENSFTADGIDNSNFESNPYKPEMTLVGKCPWGEDEDTHELLEGSHYHTYDEWNDASTSDTGADGTIQARLSGDKIIVNYTYNHASTQVTMGYDKTKPVYLVPFGEGVTLSNIKFKYEPVQEASISLSKASTTYNAKAQKPTYKIKLKNGTDVTSVYDVKVALGDKAPVAYSKMAFKEAGTYTFTATTSDSRYVSPITATYKIKQAKQTLKIGKSKVTFSGKKKIKNKKLKKNQTITVKLSGAKNGYKAAKQYSVNGGIQFVAVGGKMKQMVTYKFSKNKVKVTVKKGAPAQTYSLVLVAKNDNNYTQSNAKTLKIVVKNK